MKAKLPHAVKVGPKLFRITYRTKVVVDEGEEVCGWMRGPVYEIEISTSENRTREDILACLFHETLHAILYITGQSDSIGEMKVEEGIVVALENFLGDTINWKNSMWKEWKFVELKPAAELIALP